MRRDDVRLAVASRVAVWACGSVVGAGVVALPDDGKRLVSLSETHGPSLLDALGVTILLVAWLPVPMLLWRTRAVLRCTAGALCAIAALTGAAVLAVTIARDLGNGWVLGAAVLVAAQGLALVVLVRAKALQ